jgi:hypothetical protein
MSTDIMKKSIAKKYVDEYRRPSLVLSIILRDRSLNFEIEEVKCPLLLLALPSLSHQVHWGPVFFTLQILVDFYQVRCKQRLSRGYSDASLADVPKRGQGSG